MRVRWIKCVSCLLVCHDYFLNLDVDEVVK